MSEPNSLKVYRYEATDPRLGRHVVHDSRSLRYQVQADTSAIKSAKHKSAIPVLDQGNVGSCTGNAAAKRLTYEDSWTAFIVAFPQVFSVQDAKVDEQVALTIYKDATAIDQWPGTYPPDDTGSDGLSVAKACKARDWISGYQHATSLDAALTALSSAAVIVGTNWYDGMFDPSPDGQLRLTGEVAGGHEYVLDEIDVDNGIVWMQNSWGAGWGIGGRGWMPFSDLERLLGEDGDCTTFVPVGSQPPPPNPLPTPLQAWEAAAHVWLSYRHTSKVNVAFVKSTQTYLASLGGKS